MSDSEISRRQFSRRLTWGSAVPALAAATFASLTENSDAAESELDQKTEPDQKKEEPEPIPDPPESAWLLGLILKRYPDERYTDKAIRGILGDIGADLARGRQISEFPLVNSDEPGFVFRAWRAD